MPREGLYSLHTWNECESSKWDLTIFLRWDMSFRVWTFDLEAKVTNVPFHTIWIRFLSHALGSSFLQKQMVGSSDEAGFYQPCRALGLLVLTQTSHIHCEYVLNELAVEGNTSWIHAKSLCRIHTICINDLRASQTGWSNFYKKAKLSQLF